jgi:hypothetical protein
MEEFLMWIITVYSKRNCITMYEFNIEKEAREAFKSIQGVKVLSEIVYFNDQCFALTTV